MAAKTYIGIGAQTGKSWMYVESTGKWYIRSSAPGGWTESTAPPMDQVSLFQTGSEPTTGLPGGAGQPNQPYDPTIPAGSNQGGINTGGTGGTDPNAPGGFDVTPGMWWQLEQEKLALEKALAELQAQTQRDIANINAQSAAELQAKNAELENQLLDKRITHEEYMQQKELAQRESEFSRDLALRTLIADRTEAHQKIQDQLSTLAEVRQERLLQAQLASNPADTVLYEFYKRGGGTPEALAGAQTQANEGYRSLLGDYPAPPPAYSDQTLQQLVQGFTGGQQTPLYNPNLGGQGVFGTQIPNPGQLSHQQLSQMDPNTVKVLQSFIQGGVQTTPGVDASRVAINPEDWFRQNQQSWIPGVQTTQTQYA